MKRHTVVLPFLLPQLTDKAAAQLVALLHELFAGIEHHYAAQAHRYHKRQRDIRPKRPSSSSEHTDPPF